MNGKLMAKLTILLVSALMIITVSGCVVNDPKSVVTTSTGTPTSTPTVTSTPVATPTTVSTPEPTPVATATPASQDELWKASFINNLAIVLEDSYALSDASAVTPVDKDVLRSDYSKVETDANTALEKSKSYQVSADIQAAKAEYEQFFSDTAQSAHYGTIAIDDLKIGDNNKFRTDYATCTSYASKVSPDMDKAISLNKVLGADLNAKLINNPNVNVTRLYQSS